MPIQTSVNPGWAVISVWIIVNAVNILQSAGFLSRLRTGSLAVNHLLGYVIIALAIPAAVTLVAFLRAKADWRHWIGLVVLILFIVFMVCIEYVWPVEFRSPMRYEILIPYLLLFFGSILLMGLPMFRLNWRLWLVTVASTIFLLVSMLIAMRKGVG
jgi:phosphatidylserine synthase